MKSDYKFKISVLIVCHPKYQVHLRKALQSLNKQNLKNFQVILVLNGYEEIPELRCDSDLLILRTKETNLATACNYGVSKSSGEYIIRLDADDTFHPDIIKDELRFIEQSKVDAVFCDFYKTVEGEITEVMYHPKLEHACGVLYKREVFDKLNGYDETLEYQESFDYWIRFFKAGFKAKHLPHPYYFYQQHNGSMSTNTENRLKVRQEIIERHK